MKRRLCAIKELRDLRWFSLGWFSTGLNYVGLDYSMDLLVCFDIPVFVYTFILFKDS